MATYDAVIREIYQGLAFQSFRNLGDRIAFISQYFLGKPYLLGALGEGVVGQFDQNPLYRTDAFDCLTLVNTILAITLSDDLKEFQQSLLRINYYDGDPKYHKRFHFTSVDWNVQNVSNHFIREITEQIGDTELAITEIDRPRWFQYRDYADIKLLKSVSDETCDQLLTQMRSFSSFVRSQKSELPHLPLTELFHAGKSNNALFNRIPHGSIIEIVRPNWELRDKIGTNLNVSHIGFALWKENKLIFREASLLQKKVIDTPLKVYLQNYLSSPTVKGISVFEIVK